MFCVGIFLNVQDCEGGGRFLMCKVTLRLSKCGIGAVSCVLLYVMLVTIIYAIS